MRRRATSPGGRGRLWAWMVLLAVFIFWVYPAYFQDKANRSQNRGPEVPGSQDYGGSGQASYALLATLNTWPPVRDTEATLLLSDNLLVANYYMVLDGSGSMKERGCSGRDTKIQAARKAIAEFARSLPQDANFGLAVFTNNVTQELIPLGRENRNRVGAVLGQIDAVGSTPLRSSINLAYRKLTEQGERQLGYGEYHLVVVTDGLASEGEDPNSVVNGILAESPVNLHTIGFCIGTSHVLNQPRRSYYRAADNPEELSKGLEEVIAEAPSFDVTEFDQ